MTLLEKNSGSSRGWSWTYVAGGVALMIACASYSMPEPHGPRAPLTPKPANAEEAVAGPQPDAPAPRASAEGIEISAEAAGICDLVCEQAKVGGVEDGSADVARITKNANAVLSEMQPGILACYKKRVVAKPQAHAFMTFDILVGPDGKVLRVETTGGALLGDHSIECMVKQVEKGIFDPPKRGGTLHILVPFSLRTVSPGATRD